MNTKAEKDIKIVNSIVYALISVNWGRPLNRLDIISIVPRLFLPIRAYFLLALIDYVSAKSFNSGIWTEINLNFVIANLKWIFTIIWCLKFVNDRVEENLFFMFNKNIHKFWLRLRLRKLESLNAEYLENSLHENLIFQYHSYLKFIKSAKILLQDNRYNSYIWIF